MPVKSTVIDGSAASRTECHDPALWQRFIEANQRYCKQRLQPRFYAATQMTALECWFTRRSRTNPDGAMLEFGCGRTLPVTQLLGGRFGRCFATDLEDIPASEIPPAVTFRQCTPDSVPFADAQFDQIVIRSVLEHVTDPAKTFAELSRVIKPGGHVLMNLPNKWDYVSVLARLSGRFKSSILKSVLRTQWEDFPVTYRCNTRRALYRFAAQAGFDVIEFMPMPSQPSYLSFFVPLYLAGAIYQFAISLFALDALQPVFAVILQKRSAGVPGLEESRS